MPSVRCGDVDIYYEDRGAGPAIVWIPGTGLRGSTWELQVRRFCDRFRCLTVDLRGSGNSGGADTTFSVADLAADIAEWLDAIGVSAAVIAGLSLGSAVAQELALARPDLTTGLVLLATWSSTAREHHIRRHFESRLYALRNGPINVYAQFAFWMSSPSLFDHEPGRQAEVERLLQAHMSGTPAGTAGHFVADLGHETRDRLGQVGCPCLVVHGDEDLITLPWYNRMVADLIPGATLASIPKAGHLAWLERPGVVINPMVVEGQHQGGFLMGLGMVLGEDYVYDSNGHLLNASFKDYLAPTATDLPELTKIFEIPAPSLTIPGGQKGAGESGTGPVPAAVGNAVFDATGVRFTCLPITPQKMLLALREKERQGAGTFRYPDDKPDFTGPRTYEDWPVPNVAHDVEFDWDNFDDDPDEEEGSR